MICFGIFSREDCGAATGTGRDQGLQHGLCSPTVESRCSMLRYCERSFGVGTQRQESHHAFAMQNRRPL